MLTGLLWNQWSFLVLFSIIHFGCWWEYFKLVEKTYNTRIDIVVKWLFMICGYTLMIILFLKYVTHNFWIGTADFELNLKWTFWLFLFFLLIVFLFQNKIIPGKAKWMCFAGLGYISLSLGLMISLRHYFAIAEISIDYVIPPDWHKIVVPCTIIFSIWINDTMAYIVGSLIGKTTLSKISPKKTWEGTLGGIILATLVGGILAWQFDFDIQKVTIIAAISSIAGTFGDLFESKLKRLANVKDSGNFMPGHGGFLDRFDSLLLATPAVWLYVYFMM